MSRHARIQIISNMNNSKIDDRQLTIFSDAATNATLAIIFRRLSPLGNYSRILESKAQSFPSLFTTEPNINDKYEVISKDFNDISKIMHNTSKEIFSGAQSNSSHEGKTNWIKMKTPSTKIESKISFIKQIERAHESSQFSVDNQKNVIAKSLTNTSSYSTFNNSSISLLNVTVLPKFSNVEKHLPNQTTPHIIAKIFKNMNETSRSSELLYANNDFMSNISTVSNMKRYSSETTKPTRPIKKADLKKNAGFVVFFVFLVIFSVAAPLGNY